MAPPRCWAASAASAADFVVIDTGSVAGEVTTYRALPKRFDPAAATTAQIARFGLPPRPDRKSTPQAYRAWLQDVSPDIARVIAKLPIASEAARRGGRCGATPTDGAASRWPAA